MDALPPAPEGVLNWTPRSCRFENRFPLPPLPCWPGCGSPTLLGWPEVGRRGRQPAAPCSYLWFLPEPWAPAAADPLLSQGSD